jgi:hypothetical protein
MANLQGFNPSEHKDPGFDPWPEGDYLVINESDGGGMTPTKSGTGVRINFKLQAIAGDLKGRTMFWGINYTNPNEVSQRIGRAELAMMSRACGKPNPQDTSDLLNIPYMVHVVVTPAKGEYGAGNAVKKAISRAEYDANGGAMSPPKDGAAKTTAPSGAPAPGKAPWAK